MESNKIKYQGEQIHFFSRLFLSDFASLYVSLSISYKLCARLYICIHRYSGNELKYNVDQPNMMKKTTKKENRNRNAKIQDESFEVVEILGLIRYNDSNGSRNVHWEVVISM